MSVIFKVPWFTPSPKELTVFILVTKYIQESKHNFFTLNDTSQDMQDILKLLIYDIFVCKLHILQVKTEKIKINN